MNKYFICGMIIVASSLYCAADPNGPTQNDATDVNDFNTVTSSGSDDIVVPSRNSTEYWVIRSHTVNELTSFLTKKRAEMRENLAYFKSYIEQIDKTQDMLASDITATKDPALRAKVLKIFDDLESRDVAIPKKPLTWEQLVNIGMKFEISEGYAPIDINDKELDEFKKTLKRNEQFCIKVRKETMDLVDKAVNAWSYLGTIDKQKEFRLFVIDQKQQKEKAQEEKHLAFKEKRRELSKEQQLTEKQNVWQEKQDINRQRRQEARDRQNRMADNYNQNGYNYTNTSTTNSNRY